jgi:hypothetical protein
MLMRLEFEVTYLDGQKKTVQSRPATEVAFERRFERTVGSLFADVSVPAGASDADQAASMRSFLANLQSDYLYFLAWHASKSESPYDEWLELVDEIDWTVAKSADPTSPAVPAGS